jgi:hypothetical protein
VLYTTVTLGSLAPFTVGGLGVREAIAALLFTAAGLPGATGVAVTLLWTGIATTWALAGGIVFARDRIRRAATGAGAPAARPAAPGASGWGRRVSRTASSRAFPRGVARSRDRVRSAG